MLLALLVLIAAPASASPIRQQLIHRDALPVSSPLPSPAGFTALENDIRARGQSLAKELAAERARLAKNHYERKRELHKSQQNRVWKLVGGKSAWQLFHKHKEQLMYVNHVFLEQNDEMDTKLDKEYTEQFKSQRDRVKNLKAEWKAATGGKKKLDVHGLAVPSIPVPWWMQHALTGGFRGSLIA